MKRKQQPKRKPARYSYHRDFTGSAARIRILNPDGESVLNIYFWDDPKKTTAATAEKKAKMLVAAMNLRRGGTVELPHPFARLAERKRLPLFGQSATFRESVPTFSRIKRGQSYARLIATSSIAASPGRRFG
jgi:hypothetical protein